MSIKKSKEDEFWHYFDREEFNAKDTSIYFETEFNNKMDSLVPVLEEKGVLPRILREELSKINKEPTKEPLLLICCHLLLNFAICYS